MGIGRSGCQRADDRRCHWFIVGETPCRSIMRTEGSNKDGIKLSICITTLNRANFIGETLQSIVSQATDECEIVVLDAASTDQTSTVVIEHAARFPRLRYFRQNQNQGFDRDCDRMVELASGEYCWLMTDDDLVKEGAIATILRALRREWSLVVINAEAWDLEMSQMLWPRLLDFTADREYLPRDFDALFVDVGGVLNCNSVLIKRSLWLARDKSPYYESWLVHVGVIFQAALPQSTLVIANPLIKYRGGNSHTYSSQVSEINFVKWPAMIESFTVSASAKNRIHHTTPWKHLSMLLLCRALGFYSRGEYQRWLRPQLRSIGETVLPALVALLPRALASAGLLAYWRLTKRPYQAKPAEVFIQALRESRAYRRNRPASADSGIGRAVEER